MSAPSLDSDRLVLRAVDERDISRLVDILRQPSVAKHWPAPDEKTAPFLRGADPDGADAITAFAVTLAGDVVGWIAAGESHDPLYRHASIDVFIASEHQRAGLGPEAIARVCRWLFDERGHHRITIDPAASNVRAIRAYEKVGFQRVGILRRYERSADGTFHDGMLLDLLPEDLRLKAHAG